MPDATGLSETWRPIPEWEGYYSVSDHGRVRSEPRTVHTADGRTCRYSRRVLRPGPSLKGRLSVNLCRDGRTNSRYIAHLVALAFIGPRPPGLEVCHGDGDCSNDVPVNLRYDTPSNNRLDSVRHGTHHQAAKTECSGGHLLIAPNLVPHKLRRGGRSCLACKRAGDNVANAKRAGRPHDFQALADEHYARIMAAA